MSLSDRARRRQGDTEDQADIQRETERRPMPAPPALDLFPTRYRCTQCRRPETEGRFTKHKEASGSGWDHGGQVGSWTCFECLPKGEGRGE